MIVTQLEKVTVISCGGTIASVVQSGVGAVPSRDIGELLSDIPSAAGIADVETRAFKQVASPHMTFKDLLGLAAAAKDAFALGSSGVVITQGTDTIEEIAFGLDLLWQGEFPIVVTGAMRNGSLPGADGPANLVAALRVAASREAHGLGALVVMNDEIHAARFVRKSHTTSPATFRSALTGPIGWIAENDVRVALRPARRFHVAASYDAEPLQVCLLKVSLGDDGRLLPYVMASGYAGLVIEGFGGGHLTRDIAESGLLETLLESMPVVLASRAGSGELLRNTYGGFSGSETDLIARGVIFSGALDGPKARILLTLLLMADADRKTIRQTFAEVGSL